MSEREQDVVFEALCEVCGIDWEGAITSDERGRVNAALRQLRAIYVDDHALPQMIFERAAAWRVVHPDATLTPQALTGAWSSILGAMEEQGIRESAKRKVANAATTTHNCVCGGDHFVIVGTDAKGYDIAGPCPECGPDNPSYYVQGRLVRVIDKGESREMMER